MNIEDKVNTLYRDFYNMKLCKLGKNTSGAEKYKVSLYKNLTQMTKDELKMVSNAIWENIESIGREIQWEYDFVKLDNQKVSQLGTKIDEWTELNSLVNEELRAKRELECDFLI